MVASALQLDFRSEAVTEIGSSRAQYVKSGRLEATKEACTLVTRNKEQHNSMAREDAHLQK